jgi:hypothetical protein
LQTFLAKNSIGECHISAEGPAGGKFGTNWCEIGLFQLFDEWKPHRRRAPIRPTTSEDQERRQEQEDE